MTINTVVTALRNTMCNAFVDALDAGTAAAYVEMRTSGDALLCTVTFSATAFGAAATGVATAADFTPDTSAVASGDAEVCEFLTGDSPPIVLWKGAITESAGGGEIDFASSFTISQGDTIDITSMTATFPASG